MVKCPPTRHGEATTANHLRKMTDPMHSRPVLARLPYVYATLLVVETLWLTWRYATDMPGPVDPLSIWLGWGGLISMIVMLVYSIARRSKTLRQWARLSYWLHFHIFLGCQGMLWVTFHSAQFLTGESGRSWLNPGVLNFFAVATVFASGLFGRYLYAQLPRAVGGEQMAMREVDAELAKLTQPISSDVAALWKDVPKGVGFLALVRASGATGRALRSLKKMDIPADQRDLAKRRILLERRKAALVYTQRVFWWWIVLHRPIAIAMYVLSAVHVLLAYMFTPALTGG